MLLDEFRQGLEDQRMLNYVYHGPQDLTGIIQVWKHGPDYVLTWEESREGDQYNENRYLKDERRVFTNSDHVLNFLRDNSIDISKFEF
jgi:hypothetical protein